MAKKPTHKGPHKYHLADAGYAKVWKCAIPECSHFMPHNLTSFVVGKKSICWSCDGEMVLDERNMEDDKPTCYKCKVGISGNDIEHLADILKG